MLGSLTPQEVQSPQKTQAGSQHCHHGPYSAPPTPVKSRLQAKANNLSHLDINAATQQVGPQSVPQGGAGTAPAASTSGTSQIPSSHSTGCLQEDASHSNRESENEAQGPNTQDKGKRKSRTKRRKTLDKVPRATVLSVEEDNEVECRLELSNRNTVTFKFSLENDEPKEIAENLVVAELLPAGQVNGVIELLQQVFSLVKQDSSTAVSMCVSVANTPTSSPSSVRRVRQVTDGETGKKLDFDNVSVYQSGNDGGSGTVSHTYVECGELQDSKVVISKSRKFIVSRVCDSHLSETKIAEDDGEEQTISPDNMPSSSAHANEPDSTNPDYEKSWKSTTNRTDVPIDISDLHDKLSKLTSQRVAGQASGQAVTPGDVGTQAGQAEGQLIEGQGRPQQQSPHVQQPSTALLSQTQTSEVHGANASETSQTNPAQQGQNVPVMNTYMPHNAQQQMQMQYQGVMPPYQGMFYPPYYTADPMMQMQMHQQLMQQYMMMNQMQQQPSSSQQQNNPHPPQYMYPSGWMYPGQMPMYSNTSVNSHQSQGVTQPQGHGSEAGNTSQVISPPRSPGQSRKTVSEDGSSDGSVHSTDGRKTDLANLEQALIKKLHGNRKEVQATTAAQSATTMSTSSTGGQFEGTISGNDEMSQTDLGSSNGETVNAVNSDIHLDGEEVPSTSEIQKPVKRRSRFMVEAVSEEALTAQISSSTDVSSSKSTEIFHQSGGSMDDVVPNKTSKKGRFCVTKVKDSATLNPQLVEDMVDGSKVEVKSTNTSDSISIPSSTNITDEGSQGASMLKAIGSVISREGSEGKKDIYIPVHDPEYNNMMMRQKQQMDDLHMKHKKEVEEFLHKKGISLPNMMPQSVASPMMSPLNVCTMSPALMSLASARTVHSSHSSHKMEQGSPGQPEKPKNTFDGDLFRKYSDITRTNTTIASKQESTKKTLNELKQEQECAWDNSLSLQGLPNFHPDSSVHLNSVRSAAQLHVDTTEGRMTEMKGEMSNESSRKSSIDLSSSQTSIPEMLRQQQQHHQMMHPFFHQGMPPFFPFQSYVVQGANPQQLSQPFQVHGTFPGVIASSQTQTTGSAAPHGSFVPMQSTFPGTQSQHQQIPPSQLPPQSSAAPQTSGSSSSSALNNQQPSKG